MRPFVLGRFGFGFGDVFFVSIQDVASNDPGFLVLRRAPVSLLISKPYPRIQKYDFIGIRGRKIILELVDRRGVGFGGRRGGGGMGQRLDACRVVVDV